MAYNIRMGFGLDGRFDLPALTEVIAGQRPDVVGLNEVDGPGCSTADMTPSRCSRPD